MFDPSSRYAALPTTTLIENGPDGQEKLIRYTLRRIIPMPSATRLATHLVQPGERLDHLAARYLGDATAFWRIADTNLATLPETLTDTPLTQLHITLPGF